MRAAYIRVASATSFSRLAAKHDPEAGDDLANSTSALLVPERGQSRERRAASTEHAEIPSPADEAVMAALEAQEAPAEKLSVRETARLALRFGGFWFLANWFNAMSFEYTSVASSTILVATSSVFTLLLGAVIGVEKFTLKKLAGVAASLGGVATISLLDTAGKENDPNRGSFPYKTPAEVAVGDALALLSAVLYGLYATTLTKVVGDESRVNMPLFFGFVGVFNIGLLWPGLGILHLAGVEKFELPPDGYIWAALIFNATISLISDVAWAYAVLLTSPLVVTVGLSLTIPLSLVGQMLLNGQYSSIWYWLGAFVVVLSFIFVNHESQSAAPPPRQVVDDEE